MSNRLILTLVLPLLHAVFAGCSTAPDQIPPRSDVAAIAESLSGLIEHEMEQKRIPAMSIVLVDNQEIIWARGFGMADQEAGVPATARTMYRVGSVSKLFTDIGVMQLVERGELDLDAPVQRYLPEFRPLGDTASPITLRQLMSHLSGIVREPPVGNYFDHTEPTLEATVRSLENTGLIYPTGTRTKYSNAGIAVVGRVLEDTQDEPFAAYLKRAVLEPFGMPDCAFEPTPEVKRRLAKALMWTYDGREFEAPTFQLGMSPAGSLYASVLDLGQFMRVIFAGGGDVMSRQSLDAMWEPQFAEQTGGRYGIGFRLGELMGRRTVGHGGAVYGFATDLLMLPDDGIGVAVTSNVDVTNAVVRRISRHAVELMLASRDGRQAPQVELARAVQPDVARQLIGRWVSDDRTIEVRQSSRGLVLNTGYSEREIGQRRDGGLQLEGRLAVGVPLDLISADRLRYAGKEYTRAADVKPAPAPARWAGLIGEYGWDHSVLYVLERGGQLHALIEWIEYDPLTELSEDVYAFPARRGMYHGEGLAFDRGADGVATQARIGKLVFPRREVGTADGETFRIDPVKPVEQLRQAALAATPPPENRPRQPDLVDLAPLDPTIQFDVRYATTNNFMSSVFYQQPRAFMQRPAAEAFVAAHRSLREQGYGMLVHDAYRPWFVTKMFWDATPESMKIFVANPAGGSRHNRGAAIDITLYDLATGAPVQMTGGYDEFSERSYPDYPGGTSLQRWHRELLRETMEAHGFSVYEFEWWHFDYKDWRAYPILNLTFEQLDG